MDVAACARARRVIPHGVHVAVRTPAELTEDLRVAYAELQYQCGRRASRDNRSSRRVIHIHITEDSRGLQIFAMVSARFSSFCAMKKVLLRSSGPRCAQRVEHAKSHMMCGACACCPARCAAARANGCCCGCGGAGVARRNFASCVERRARGVAISMYVLSGLRMLQARCGRTVGPSRWTVGPAGGRWALGDEVGSPCRPRQTVWATRAVVSARAAIDCCSALL